MPLPAHLNFLATELSGVSEFNGVNCKKSFQKIITAKYPKENSTHCSLLTAHLHLDVS